MAINLGGKKKAKCADCGIDLGFKDYICAPDPYSPEGSQRPRRVNLCQKCHGVRVDKRDKMLGEKDMSGDKETIVSTEEIMDMIKRDIEELPPEQRPSSNKSRKKKKLEKKIRRELIKRYKEENVKKLAQDD